MTFHQLTLSDRDAMQAVTLLSGRRNCNYTFANLVGWKFLFGTEVCVLDSAVVLRYTFEGQRAYMVCTSEALSLELIEALLEETVDWMVRQYGFDRAEVEAWVQDLHFNWLLSVKALDENSHVIGLLNMSDYRIEEETPQILEDKPELIKSLNAKHYIAVFSFIVAEEYRGTRLNYDMLMSIMSELKTNYDFIFIPVLRRLKTHQYWQRWGAKEFYRDEHCVDYKLDI